MKVALLSDVHANLVALRRVLQDAKQQGCQAVWYLGDAIGYGPRPSEVVQLLAEKADLAIRGNYDRKAFELGESWKGPNLPVKRLGFEWARESLSEESASWLESLPGSLRYAEAGWHFLLVHGSLSDDQERIAEDMPTDRLRELAQQGRANVVLCGHTHRQVDFSAVSVRWINPGSVGRTCSAESLASYAVLSFDKEKLDVEFRRIKYDAQKTAEDLDRQGLPESFGLMFREGIEMTEALEKMRTIQNPSPEEDSRIDAILEFARSCDYEADHSQQVTRLALMLFDQLRGLHGLGRFGRFQLRAAGLLHDIGWIKGQRRHHKTARDLILRTSRLPLSDRERLIIALIARYHRRAIPSPTHRYFDQLRPADRYRVSVLAGLLRAADGLDRGHRDMIEKLCCSVQKDSITVHAKARSKNALLEIETGQKKSKLLETALRREVRIVSEAVIRPEKK